MTRCDAIIDTDPDNTRQPIRGMAWDFTGPGIPDDFALVPVAGLPNDGHVSVTVARVADTFTSTTDIDGLPMTVSVAFAHG